MSDGSNEHNIRKRMLAGLDSPTGHPAHIIAHNKSSKKLKIVIVLASIAALLLGGASSYAYMALVQNNPQRVVADALLGVFSGDINVAEGSLKVTFPGSGSAQLTYDTKVSDAAAKVNAKLSLSGINGQTSGALNGNYSGSVIAASGGDVFFKIGNFRQLVQQQAGGDREASVAGEELIPKLENKWIKFATGAGDAQSAREQKCLQKAYKEFKQNAQWQRELADSYARQPFITIDQQPNQTIKGVKAFHYLLSQDAAKSKAFDNDVKQSSLYKAVAGCGNGLTNNLKVYSATDTTNASQPTIELWVDRLSHMPLQLRASLSNAQKELLFIDSYDFVINMRREEDLNISLPKDTLPYEQAAAEYGIFYSQTPEAQALAAPFEASSESSLRRLPSSAGETELQSELQANLNSVFGQPVTRS